jgi:3-isopropylmalate/(R)-2-methylmalate dehydratase small subunit
MSAAVTQKGGRAWVYGDNVDTDMLAPGMYMKKSIEEIATHCLEALDPGFAKGVRPGDVLVGGENFGMGSSREQAAQALVQLGVAAVIAKSFSGLYLRNALNLGLMALECSQCGRIGKGELLVVDPEKGHINNLTTGERYACEPIPPHLVAMIRDGGLVPHLEKKLKGGKT